MGELEKVINVLIKERDYQSEMLISCLEKDVIVQAHCHRQNKFMLNRLIRSLKFQ